MSIVPLERVRFVGLLSEKESLLDDLHRFGVLELIPFGDSERIVRGGPSNRSREALRFLLSAPQRRRQVRDRELFDAPGVERRALELQDEIRSLKFERDDLIQRLDAAKPFGDFCFASLEQMGGLRLWFYVVPRRDMDHLERIGVEEHSSSVPAWQVVSSDPQNCYVAVVSPDEPTTIPGTRARIGIRGPSELARRIEQLELAIEDAQAERSSLTRWCFLFARSLASLEDASARHYAAEQTCDLDPLFALEAWVPREHVEELSELANKSGLVFEHRPPTADDDPPTLVANEDRVEAGEDLVNFYMTPGYWTWDPSSVVLVSFAIFFAMILADAGYAAVMGLGLLLFWRKLGRPTTEDAMLTRAADIEQGQPVPRRTAGQRFRPLLLLIVSASMLYGVLVGSYFGLTPDEDTLLGRLHLLDMSDSRLMMGVAVVVGAGHVILANIMDARRHTDWRDGLASWGWAAAVAGALAAAAGVAIPAAGFLKMAGTVSAVAGLVLVVAFTARHEKPLGRMLGGLLGLTKISAAFGDVLSYLRLFALGLASASLATAFNDMATGIYSGLPRLGLLFAILVLLFGHALNMLLGVSSGVIHGLRLNVIEFFNWGLKDEGRRFIPFRRKEGSLWK